jgi:hypothetical protein
MNVTMCVPFILPLGAPALDYPLRLTVKQDRIDEGLKSKSSFRWSPSLRQRATNVDSLVGDIDAFVVTIVTPKLGDTHSAIRHRKAKKDPSHERKDPLIDEHGLNDSEAEDHSENYEEGHKD